MEEVLRLLGSGTCITSMVLQSFMMLSIQEDVDYQWWVRTEYRFKGLNCLGFRHRANKMTSNKYQLENEKPDVLEDWDKR